MLLLIGDLTLWLLVALHFVGGAALFRRLLPDESPWLGYLAPMGVFVLGLNFIEHLVALPALLGLLPFTLGGALWAILTPGYSWRGLRLPTAVFLLVFGFCFALRLFHPDVPTNDGMADMNRILNYSFGDRLPPTDGWLPPYDYRWYYSFQHYGASVLKRLFALDIGTTYNLSFALLNGLVCFVGSAVAYRIGGGRTWVALIVIPVLEAGFTGSMPYLLLTMREPDFGYGVDLDAGWRNGDPGWIFQLLKHDAHQALVLEAPGDWIWHDQFHPNLSGFLLVFTSALCGLEILEERRSTVPWVVLTATVPLSLLAATWYFPLCLALVVGSGGLALMLGRRPQSIRGAAIAVLLVLGLAWPTLNTQAGWHHHQTLRATPPDWQTPFWVFVIQWWPIYLPWLVLCFFWRSLGAGARWMHVSIAILFVAIEYGTVGDWRWDTVEKMWGAVFGLGLVTLVPLLLVRPSVLTRFVVLLLAISTLLTLRQRLNDESGWIDWDNGFLHLDGNSYIRNDEQHGRMLEVLRQLHKSILLAGKCGWNYTSPPGLAVFSENRCYVAWFTTEEIMGRNREVAYRTKLNNQFYDGGMDDPDGFLRANRIDAVLISPEDTIGATVLAGLRQKLAADFEYVDCQGHGLANAGVFLRRPLPALPRD